MLNADVCYCTCVIMAARAVPYRVPYMYRIAERQSPH
jgi:hypothetical protein